MTIKRMTGKLNVPSKDLIYGVEGVGKSGLAAQYPIPIFLDFEGSTHEMNVDRVPIDNWDDLVEIHRLICTDKAYANIKTVVYDTLDWMETIIIKQILKEDGAMSITDSAHYGFGNGDKRIGEFIVNEVLKLIKAVMRKRINVVFVAHSEIKAIECPLVGRYDMYAVKSGKKIASIFKEWCSNVFFINYETHIEYKKGMEKNRAKGGRMRYIHTQRTPQYEAKTRLDINDRLLYNKDECPYFEYIGAKEVEKNPENRLYESLKAISEINDIDELNMFLDAYSDLKGDEGFEKAVSEVRESIETKTDK